jgi:hypothetical protein
MSSLKQFIRNVRAAKTIADERAVVQKESAAIRASFREESHDSNVRYVPYNLPSEVVDRTDEIQAEQCCEAIIPVYTRRTDSFWTDRMPETARFPTFCGQAAGVSRNHVVTGREPGGADIGHQLIEEVRGVRLFCTGGC